MDHYTILNLPVPFARHQHGIRTKSSSPEEVKQAYRAALLMHHPDKTKASPVSNITNKGKPSVDAIKTAYKILSDPELREEYDRELLLERISEGTENTKHISTDTRHGFRTGEELIDLDDMAYDDTSGSWFRACRCGESKGYTVTEAQLEGEERKNGREVVVGCCGCSLWLRVAFDVSEEQSDGEDT
ncbi:DnaJ-domain-containing protein [Tothia fuscella]|uniref:Diphthamide biosynthesis protein 4 n=1 Tax=Tothia fuscella TaxID=1048955 RepID=A0A9P4NXB3_9PEZI|nr:DnaJ-domain-containing protein [Tothia fuscella]